LRYGERERERSLEREREILEERLRRVRLGLEGGSGSDKSTGRWVFRGAPDVNVCYKVS
jgi:hypothetical protein